MELLNTAAAGSIEGLCTPDVAVPDDHQPRLSDVVEFEKPVPAVEAPSRKGCIRRINAEDKRKFDQLLMGKRYTAKSVECDIDCSGPVDNSICFRIGRFTLFSFNYPVCPMPAEG